MFHGYAAELEAARERFGGQSQQLVPLAYSAALRAPPDGLVGHQARLLALSAARAGLPGPTPSDSFSGCLATNMVVEPPLGSRYDALGDVRHLDDWFRRAAESPDGATLSVRSIADMGRMPGSALAGMCAGCSHLLSLESVMLSRAMREACFGVEDGTLLSDLARLITSPEWPCWENTRFAASLQRLLAEGQATLRTFISEYVTGNVLRASLDSLPAAERAGLAAADAKLAQVAAAAFAAAVREGYAQDDTSAEFVAPEPVFSDADLAAIAQAAEDLGVDQQAPTPPPTSFVQGLGRLFDACLDAVAEAGGVPVQAVRDDLAAAAVTISTAVAAAVSIFAVMLRTSPSQGQGTAADRASFAIQEAEAVRELFLLGLPAIPGVAMGATTLAQLVNHYSPAAGLAFVVEVYRADCEPSMGYFAQRVHVQDGVAGPPVTGAELLANVLSARAAAPNTVVYAVFPECSRFCAADVNEVLRASDPRVRWVFADLHAAAAAGAAYLPPGLLVAGTWLNIGSQAARAIFCVHLWAAHLLPRILVRLQRTVGQWA